MNKSAGALIFFGLFWSTLTLMFDGFTILPALRQVLAQRFAATSGTILSSAVTDHSDSDGTTYGVQISYTYSVGGREYTGDRFRYGKFSSSDSTWAHQAVAAHSPGSTTMVYYDPRQPEESVLTVGLQGSDLFMALFMTPFNAVMLGLWWYAISRLRRKARQAEAGGVRLRVVRLQTRVRLTEFSPVATGIATTALLAFLSIFVVGFAFGGFHPSLRVASMTWVVVLFGGIAAAIWHGQRIVSGRYDLVLDEGAGTMQLPRTGGRKTVRTLLLAEIHNAFVDTIAKCDSEGSTSYTYVPTLRMAAADGPTEKLAEWHDADRAGRFVAWLNEKLGPHRK